MADYQLISDRPLAGYDRDFGHVHITALADLALVSIALPRGGEDAARAAIEKRLGVALPDVGRYATASDGARLIRTSPDQAMVLFDCAEPIAERLIAEKLGSAAYTTDQTDTWVILSVQGPGVRRTLERICPLDLHHRVFTSDMAQRTTMEHLGTLILRTGEDTFLLMSASSSAGSFLHAVETSATNTS